MSIQSVINNVLNTPCRYDKEPVKLYVGLCADGWNYHPVAPGKYACISPIFGRTEETRMENRVAVPDGTVVLEDSGAFSDSDKSRLSFRDALRRQECHAKKYKYWDKLDGLSSYDLLIDEKWIKGQRYKKRWSENDASEAVETTIAAAKYLSDNRHNIPSNLVLSAQGVTPDQYLYCVQRLHSFMTKEDVLGLGGWCILGWKRELVPSFFETMSKVIPFVSKENVVTKIHIWGVLYPKALGALLYLCDRHNLQLSTDSVGPQLKPQLGSWGYDDWTIPNYQKVPTKDRGLERARHVELTREWLARFRLSKHYIDPLLTSR